MFTILAVLLAPALLGLPIAAWAYPWRKPVARPYAWYLIALATPLLLMVLLQVLFGLPPGTCSETPLKYIPPLLALAGGGLVVALLAKGSGHRLFIAGLAIAIYPPTILWSVLTMMSLAGCWI